MTSALRMRAEFLLDQDRAARSASPCVRAETYVSSSGTYGSTLYGWLAGDQRGSVSESTALRVGAVHACVGLIGGAIAAMPFHLYKRTPDGRDRYESDVWWLLNESPEPAWTAASAWQFALQCILLRGDGFRQIHRASPYDPRIIGFEPIHPDAMQVERVENRNRYTFWVRTGTASFEKRVKDQDDILHFPGIGFDGLRSLTPISAALGQAANLALSAENHAAAFFRGGARPDQAIVVPAGIKVDEDQKAAIKETWSKQQSHYDNTGIPPLLVGGMDIKPLSINAVDSQLLESRQQSVEDIARIMGCPPHMIGKTDASTSWGTGIQQMSIGFLRFTIGRHLEVISQELNRKIWPRSRAFYGEFNRDAMLEGDSKEQAEYLTKALGGPGTQGWMSVNEVRRLKNMRPSAEPWANTVQMAGSKAAGTSPPKDTQNA